MVVDTLDPGHLSRVVLCSGVVRLWKSSTDFDFISFPLFHSVNVQGTELCEATLLVEEGWGGAIRNR